MNSKEQKTEGETDEDGRRDDTISERVQTLNFIQQNNEIRKKEILTTHNELTNIDNNRCRQ